MEKLKTKKVGKNIVVNLEGRMDVHLSAEIENQLNELILEEKEANIVLDLSGVDYMSSSGLRIFVATMRQLKESNRRLVLCSLNPSVRKVFEVVELMDMFDITDTADEALKTLG